MASYARVLKLPQYFRNLHRLREIIAVLIKHGFGDIVARLQLSAYLESGLQLIRPVVTPVRSQPSNSHLDLSARARLVCEELGTSFIKFGQLVATRPDIFPMSLVNEFRKLHDAAPPFAASVARSLIAEELGHPVSDLFASFDDAPLGAASIAQVHAATLNDGREVVVKVQRPGLDRLLDTDLDILRGLAALLEEHMPESRAFEPLKLVEEFSRSLRRESDFRREAASMRRFADNFQGIEGVRVPLAYPALSSRRVLVQERVDGVRIDDLAALASNGVDRCVIARRLTRVVLKSVFEDRFFHADPHPGNILIDQRGAIVLIDFGMMGRFDPPRLQEILQLLLAVIRRDAARLVRLLQEAQMASLLIDERNLKAQLSEVLEQHVGRTLGTLNLAEMLGDIFAIVRRFGIRLPPDILLVGKSLSLLEYIGAQLDPDFEPLSAVQPYLVRRYARMRADPRAYSIFLRDVGDSYRRLFAELPTELREITRNLARDRLTLRFSDADRDSNHVNRNRILNRGLCGLLAIIATSIGILLVAIPSRISLPGAYAILGCGLLLLFVTWRAVSRSGGL